MLSPVEGRTGAPLAHAALAADAVGEAIADKKCEVLARAAPRHAKIEHACKNLPCAAENRVAILQFSTGDLQFWGVFN
jgi:hypothetical protein